MEKYDVAKAAQVSERLADRQGAEQRAVVEFLSLFKNFERKDGSLRVVLRSEHEVELRWAPHPPMAGITTERVVALRWSFDGLRASRRKEVDRVVHSLGEHIIKLSYDVARDAIVPSEPHPHDALTFTMIEVWKLLEELR
jgi:hypothetical protein